jgi:hypothetical protein
MEIYLLYHWLGIHRLSRTASHGAAISIIIAMYYFSKNILQNLALDFRPRRAVASGAIFCKTRQFL